MVSHTVADGLEIEGPTGYTSGSGAISLAGWTTRRYTNTVGGRTETVTVYTDIKAPARETFAMAYGLLAPRPLAPVPMASDPGDAPMPVDPDSPTTEETEAIAAHTTAMEAYTAYTGYLTQLRTVAIEDFAATDPIRIPVPGQPFYPSTADNRVGNEAGDDNDMFWSLVDQDSVALTAVGEGVTETFNMDRGFEATFDGVRGMVMCRAATCAINRTDSDPDDEVEDNDGPLTSPGDDWEFVARNHENLVNTRREDGDYIQMGWWLDKPVDPAASHKFARFVNGGASYEGAIGSVTGSATYEGKAVGLFSMRQRKSEAGAHGEFRADVELTANFEETSTGADDEGVTGTVDNFYTMGSDGGQSRDWVLTFTNSADDGIGTASPTGGNAEGHEWTGSWSAAWFGDDPHAAANSQPRSIAGMFNADAGTPERTSAPETPPADDNDAGFVGVAGVFAAHRQDDD
jgi:hypothetical protein